MGRHDGVTHPMHSGGDSDITSRLYRAILQTLHIGAPFVDLVFQTT
jgi:hypothetical protein